MSERHMARLAVYLLFEQDGKVLFLKRHNTGYRDREYTLPAGHVEASETFEETAIREAREEVCLGVVSKDLTLVHVMQRYENGINVIDFYFAVRAWSGIATLGEPHKASEVRWISREEVSTYSIPFITKAIKYAARNTLLSQDGIGSLGS